MPISLTTTADVSGVPNRRILHQPFFPLVSSPPPPSPPPLPPPPPQNIPFFPSYPSPPSPPPPSPASLASFPANISSLVIPQNPNSSKPPSQKLIAGTISAVVATIIVLSLLSIYYLHRRRRRLSSSDEVKTQRSDHSSSRRTSNYNFRLRTGSFNFLYLGNIVNSQRNVNEETNSNNDDDSHNNARALNSHIGSDPKKFDSPELRPLPLLIHQSSRRNFNAGSTTDDEFYSPRGSIGSGSMRVVAALDGGDFGGQSGDTSSYSSSTSGSPARSHSGSTSPPVSLSPIRPKSTPSRDPPAVEVRGDVEWKCLSSESGSSPSRIEDQDKNSLRSASMSPERNLEMSNEALVLQRSNDSDEFRSSQSVSSSRERKQEVCMPIMSNELELLKYSQSLSQSPGRNVEMTDEIEASLHRESCDLDLTQLPSSSTSPRKSSYSDQAMCLGSVSLLSPLPEIDVEMTQEASLRRRSSDLDLTQAPSSSTPRRKSNDLDRAMCSQSLSSLSSSPDRNVGMTREASPTRMLNDLDQATRSQSASLEKIALPDSDYDDLQSISPLSSSPERDLEKTRDQAMRSQSHSLLEKIPSRSSSLSSYCNSPDRVSGNDCLHDQSDGSSRVSSASMTPGRSFQNSSRASSPIIMSNNVGLNERISSVLKHSDSAAPPPPPPPPPPPLLPLMRQQRRWSLPVAATTTDQSIIKPPEITPPPRPFAWQSTTDVSPIKLSPSSDTRNSVEVTPKPKLKPLHWDKVRATSDREMVWDQLRSSSFKLNEEIFDTLFVVNTHTPKPKQPTLRPVLPSPNQENRVLDPKRAQNIAISLRALNVTIDEVCEALLEGNVDTLGTELLESLLKMAPTKEEELKLKEFKDDSLYKLVQAERFLKAILDVPFAFQRLEVMLYVANFDTEVEYLKSSFETLEGACEELRSSRMFLKLLEAVLKTGNRMNVGTNRGDAHAFKLDTLLKLVDVKGADGKTTLLHFVVQEVIRTEGARISGTSQTPDSASCEDAKCRKLGLQVVSGLSSELTNVRKAAAMDSDALSSDVSKLSRGIANIGEVVQLIKSVQTGESNEKFPESMSKFVTRAEEEIFRLQAHESVAMTLVKEITEYIHGDSAKEEAHPFRIFMVVRDFLTVLDRVCKEVGMINERTMVSSSHKFPVPVNPTIPQAALFASTLRRPSSSDDESESP